MGHIDDLGSDGELVTFVRLIHAQTLLFWTPNMHTCSGQALEPSNIDLDVHDPFRMMCGCH